MKPPVQRIAKAPKWPS